MKILRRTMQATFAASVLLAGAMGAMAAQGALRAYYANDPVGRNVVTIESRAPLETMLTRTGAVVGHVQVNPDNLLNAQARFEIDLNTLETGIKMRDEHMKGADWLDTAKYPKAVFTLTKVLFSTPGLNEPVVLPLRDGQTTNLDAAGMMSLHGIAKPVTVQFSVTPVPATKDTEARLKGDLLHVRATFDIKLSDFGINVPEPAKLKIADTQTVTADIFASTGSDAPVADAPTAGATKTE